MLNSLLRRQPTSILSIGVLLFLFHVSSTASADGVALSGRVVNPDVVYSIASAERSFTLLEDAVFALAAGDTLTTGRGGRVYVRLEDALEILVLPNTHIEIVASEVAEPESIRLLVRIDGSAIARFSDLRQTQVVLEIEADHSTIRADEGWFAVWSNLENGDVVTVAQGNLRVEALGRTEVISPEDAIRVDRSSLNVIQVQPPYNGARVIGIIDGCDGRVQSLLPLLNIRAGTTLGYAEIGFLDNGAQIRIMGRTTDGNWYRIQRFSGFGWVLSSAVQTDCVPPEYPNLYGENNRELFNVEGIELVLLTPFYGSFESDPWFYRWLEPPT